MTARKDFLQSLTLGKKSEPTAEYAPSLRSPWRASTGLKNLGHKIIMVRQRLIAIWSYFSFWVCGAFCRHGQLDAT
ncbi:hypothetical protein [Candidiatus Paracoxiella cheracis]|uniref:hypothetical protein n=1 Tax=Candidiatus Paracoxiella cheracis TaxID=3405120 RepID=UPI003BF53684